MEDNSIINSKTSTHLQRSCISRDGRKKEENTIRLVCTPNVTYKQQIRQAIPGEQAKKGRVSLLLTHVTSTSQSATALKRAKWLFGSAHAAAVG